MLAAITFTLFSCDWFSKKEKPVSLAGKWKVITLADSSTAGIKGSSWFGGFNADSSNAVFTLGEDSSLVYTTLKEPMPDSAKYYTDEGLHNIYVRDNKDNKVDTFPVVLLNDTLLTVVKDSLHISLKRLP